MQAVGLRSNSDLASKQHDLHRLGSAHRAKRSLFVALGLLGAAAVATPTELEGRHEDGQHPYNTPPALCHGRFPGPRVNQLQGGWYPGVD